MARRKRQSSKQLQAWLANANRRAKQAEDRADRLQREIAGYKADSKINTEVIEILKRRNAELAEQNSELRARERRLQ